MSHRTKRLYREARENATSAAMAWLLAIYTASMTVVTWHDKSAMIIVFFILTIYVSALGVHYSRKASEKFHRAFLAEMHERQTRS